MDRKSDARSRFLSLLLRHKPEKASLSLDEQGWCSIQQILENTDFTLSELMQIVREDEKRRYSTRPSYSDCVQAGEQPLEIRANQGHTVSGVKLQFQKVIPPPTLYHGTDEALLKEIFRTGLKPMMRHHVHLSPTLDVAEAVGGRRRRVVTILTVDTVSAVRDGVQFYISENGVYLADAVPAKYLRRHE